MKDLLEHPNLSEDGLYKLFLARGVFKWFAVRRDIIKLKTEWKRRLRILYDTRRGMKVPPMRQYTLGYIQALEDCRRDLRALCHSDRWQAPDNDRRANYWLLKHTPMPEVCDADVASEAKPAPVVL